MKLFLLNRLFVTTALIGTSVLGAAIVHAQTTNASSVSLPTPMLDHDEMAQLNRAREAVFQAHPELKAESEKLKAMHDANSHPTADQRNATFAEWKSYQKTMRADMLADDPTLKPIFAKIDTARAKNGSAPFQPAPAK